MRKAFFFVFFSLLFMDLFIAWPKQFQFLLNNIASAQISIPEIDSGLDNDSLNPERNPLSREKPFPLRTHQPIYQNPFDLSAGGASLTKASQEGAFFVNPSLPAFGRGLHRWAFLRTQVHLGNATAKAGFEAYKNQGSGTPISTELLTSAIKQPNHAGHDTAAGYINKYFSMIGFSNARADLALRKFGDAGAPQVRARAYGIGGGGAGVSYALGQFLALGATAKYIEVAEVAENISIADLQDPETLSARVTELLKRGSGISTNAGMTIQLRTQYLDLRLAATVNDIGGTALGESIDPFLQTVHAGAGLTIHGRDNSLHCAADLRDVLGAYFEHWTFRSYTGCKLMFYKLIGLGAGLSQGYPTAGVVIDLFFSRIEAGTYTREVGSQIGIEGRQVYFLALGTEF